MEFSAPGDAFSSMTWSVLFEPRPWISDGSYPPIDDYHHLEPDVDLFANPTHSVVGDLARVATFNAPSLSFIDNTEARLDLTTESIPNYDQPTATAPSRLKRIPKPHRPVTKNARGEFVCTFPGCTEGIRGFGRKCEWEKHMDKHERPYKCVAEGCEKLPSFTYSGGLLRHEREVHGKHGVVKSELTKYLRRLHTKNGSRTAQIPDFSSGQKQYIVEGHVGRTSLEAFPDTGADVCFISPSMASDLGLDVTPGTGRTIRLANKKSIQSPGTVWVPWVFSGERTAHMLECWVLPGCVHSLVLGNQFLRATQTLTKFASRIKSKLAALPKRLHLRLLGEEKQRLWGHLDGHLTAALPDTGSDVMLISHGYAEEIGLTIDHDFENWLEVEFADGSTAWTSGVARGVPWKVGGKTVHCEFHILDDLCVDVVLSKDYLFEMRVFSEHLDCFFDTDSEEDLFQLCNIRRIGRFGDTLSGLEEGYLEDGIMNMDTTFPRFLANTAAVTSPGAFGPEMVQWELARRDQIRDQILALPESHRGAASQAEAERQRRWQNLRQAHRTEAHVGGPQASDRQPSGEAIESGPHDRPACTTQWKKKFNVFILLRYLRRGEKMP